MAQIVINEISQNYTYAIGTNSYAIVALPITACWGPCYQDPEAVGKTDIEEVLEGVSWDRYPATQEGLEAFVSAYRGPASNYRLAKDYSYQMAMTLMTAGYDVLVCRVCPGTNASGTFTIGDSKTLTIKAKYPGTFGNNLRIILRRLKNYSNPGTNYWNLVVYVVDSSGIQTAVENLSFVFDEENSTDTLLQVDEIESNFITIVSNGSIKDTDELTTTTPVDLTGGTDKAADSEVTTMIADAVKFATARYEAVGETGTEYTNVLNDLTLGDDISRASTLKYLEWIYTAAYHVLGNLDDKLTYNPNRIMTAGWDDQNISFILGEYDPSYTWNELSPLHIRLMNIAYDSRCAAAYIDIPKSLPRSLVWNSDENTPGYAQRLARYSTEVLATDADSYLNNINVPLYSTHSALFAPWGQYTYVGTSKMNDACPSFLALMIERAMILNQSIQYEWALPTNRKHNLNIGKLAYNVPKKLLDQWQTLEGVGVNVITNIPDMGVSLWGNSTLFEVPPATYQALANLSTRKLVNAVEDLVYRCGIAITFRYNNDEAYSSFYAGVSPLLDTMRNVGAIDDYYITMAADINGRDRVNANTVIGKIYLVVNGVVNDIYVDLIALPPGTDLAQYQQ